MAPDFKLKGTDGKEYSLSQFRGKRGVVIAWFPKAFNGGCVAECNSIREVGPALREFDVAIFAASCDPLEGARGIQAFADSLKLDFPVLSDPDKKVAKEYGVVYAERNAPERWTFFIDREGRVQFVDQRVNPKEHGRDVLKKLEQLGTPKKK
jgi:peroxiredoxin Q/BCP